MRGARKPPERTPGAVPAATRTRYKRPVSVLVVVYTRAGEALLLERRVPPGYWQSVTGSLRRGEAPATAARRELMEETGLGGAGLVDCRMRNRFRILPEWHHRYAPRVRYNTEHVFKLEVLRRRAVTLNPREHVACRWLPWPEAARLAASETNRNAIRVICGHRQI